MIALIIVALLGLFAVAFFGGGMLLTMRYIRVRKMSKELDGVHYKLYTNGQISKGVGPPPLSPPELDDQMVKNINVAEVATLTTVGALELLFLAGKTGASISTKLGTEGLKDMMENLLTPENMSVFGRKTYDVISTIVATQPGEVLVEHFDSLLANSVKGLVTLGVPKVLHQTMLNQLIQVEALLNMVSSSEHIEALETMFDHFSEQDILELDFVQEALSEAGEQLAEVLGSEIVESGLNFPVISIAFGIARFVKRDRNDIDLNRNLEFTAVELGPKVGVGAIGMAIGTAVLPGVGSVLGGLAGTLLGGAVGNKLKHRHFNRETKDFQEKMMALQGSIMAFNEPYSRLVEADLNYRLGLAKLGQQLLERGTLVKLKRNLGNMIHRYQEYDEGLVQRYRSRSIWSWLWPSKSDLVLRRLYKERQPYSQVKAKLGQTIARVEGVERSGDAAQIGLYIYQNQALHPFIPDMDLSRRARKIDRAKADWLNPDLRDEVARHRDLVIESESQSSQAYDKVIYEAAQLEKKLQPYETFFVTA
jgi:hypothetical protein